MPGLDGMEVLRRAKELDRDLPVIMITAQGSSRGRSRRFGLAPTTTW